MGRAKNSKASYRRHPNSSRMEVATSTSSSSPAMRSSSYRVHAAKQSFPYEVPAAGPTTPYGLHVVGQLPRYQLPFVGQSSGYQLRPVSETPPYRLQVVGQSSASSIQSAGQPISYRVPFVNTILGRRSVLAAAKNIGVPTRSAVDAGVLSGVKADEGSVPSMYPHGDPSLSRSSDFNRPAVYGDDFVDAARRLVVPMKFS